MHASSPDTPSLSSAALACAALTGAVLLSLLATPDGDARMPPAPPDASNNSYTCELPVDAARSVRAAFEEHYECLDPHTDGWFARDPDHVERLDAQYDVWKASRDHDLRDRDEAARFVRNHPVDFSSQEISLSDRDVASMTPTMSADPASLRGQFQRFFVDRDQQRLFVTTDQEGLTSLDISQRFAFDVEGTMDRAGGREFFVIDEQTAVVEEENDLGSARDLVVLAISDRGTPEELHRLSGVLPQISRPTLSAIPDRPPTFDEYRAIQRGQLSLGQCGQPPTVSTHRDQFCHPDGSCYRVEQRNSPVDEAYCERGNARSAPPHRVRQRQLQGRLGRQGATDDMAPPPGSPRPMRAMESAPAEVQEEAAAPEQDSAPRGGDGGAGSLSQMMVIGSTLYVLSADDTLDHGWLSTFDIAEPRRPQLTHVVGLDNGPEALQRHDNLLLIAGRDALVTASTAIPDGPRLLGERRQSCPVDFDPVVVEGAIAYRTIIVDHPRSTCNSRLEVIDLSQPHHPQLRTTRNIDRPRGLAVLGHRLFVADEHHGVRLFDITDPVAPAESATWQLPGVKDLVLSDFDLYAMTDDQISTYFVAPLYKNGAPIAPVADGIKGVTTVTSP